MIALDANILLYAYHVDAPEHERARAWLEMTFSEVPAVGLPLVSLLAFIRISTDRRLSDVPYTPRQATEIVAGWLTRENIFVLEPGTRHWPIFFAALRDASATGPRITDAHLAALAIEHGATFHTNDRDFRAFRELDVRFPLQDP
jgi:toxin-antitoxin system PIN domain toxin